MGFWVLFVDGCCLGIVVGEGWLMGWSYWVIVEEEIFGLFGMGVLG